MHIKIITILLTLALSFTSIAQTIEKVRGNKNVTTVQTEISPFHTIIVDEDFEVEIIYNRTPSVTIETDENLHEFIKFDVRNGVLTFDKTARITSKKRLNITVNYDESLNNIKTTDKGEILSLATMELPNAIIITEGASKAELTLKTNIFEFQGKERSKVKLNLTCENAKLNLTDYSKIDALIYAPETTADLYQRATVNIEGETDDLLLRTDNFSSFNGKNFTIKTCTTLNEISSDAYLEVQDTVTIEASGSSSIYLYGNAKIIVDKLENTSKIQKKEK
jgi:Putative auto-transporter adhesin, head GIN domain